MNTLGADIGSVNTLGADIGSVTFPEFLYLGKTKPKINLPREIFDEFALGKSAFSLVKVCSVTTAITGTSTPYDSYVAPNGRVCRGKSRNSGLVEIWLIFKDLPKYDQTFLRQRHLL